jgi:O-antigen/teichoic acid export membrane protein
MVAGPPYSATAIKWLTRIDQVPPALFAGHALHADVIAWLRRFLGIDRAVAFTVVARGWSSIAGLAMLILIVKFLTPAEQGYYYTLWSLVALQVVFELGFFAVILQLAAHEAAALRLDEDGSVSGDVEAHRRLASIVQWSVRWYAAAAALMAVCLIPVGIHFFRVHPQPGPPVNWLLPWCAVVAAVAFKFQVDPMLSLLEGCGYIPQVARVRMWQSMTSSILGCAMLAAGIGLFAPAAYIFGQGVAATAWLYSKRRLIWGLFTYDCHNSRIDWKEIWPFQWRIAVSWLSGYFIYQLFNPVLFTYWGATAAGQMGMALNIVNAISSVTIAWISTKSALFGNLIARKQYAELDFVFFRALKQSVALCILACAMVLAGDLYMRVHHLALADRLIDPVPLAMLLCIPVLGQITSSQALYLRAHKQEKFMLLSLIGAVCVSCSTFLLGQRYGITGMTAGYLAVSVLVGLTSGTWTFLKYRKAWHE